MEKMKSREAKLKNRTLTNRKATILIDRWIQKNFQSQGTLAEGGTGWQKLSPATIAGRRKGKKKSLLIGGQKGQTLVPGTAKILQDTGQLRTRWKHYYTARTAVLQSGVEYGIYHEEGRGVPKRKILPTKKQILPELLKLFGRHVKTSLD